MKNLKNEITKLKTTKYMFTELSKQLTNYLTRKNQFLLDMFVNKDVSVTIKESGEILIQSKSATQYRPIVRVLEKGISIITRQKEFTIDGFAREMALINEALEVVQSDEFKDLYEELMYEIHNYVHVLSQYDFRKEYNELVDKIIEYVGKNETTLNEITYNKEYTGGVWTFAVDVINSMLEREIL